MHHCLHLLVDQVQYEIQQYNVTPSTWKKHNSLLRNIQPGFFLVLFVLPAIINDSIHAASGSGAG